MGEVVRRFSRLITYFVIASAVSLAVGAVLTVVGVYYYFMERFAESATFMYSGIMFIVFALGAVSYAESYVGWRVWVGIYTGGSAFAIFSVAVLLSVYPFFAMVPLNVKAAVTAYGFMGMVLGLSGFVRLWRLAMGGEEHGESE